MALELKGISSAEPGRYELRKNGGGPTFPIVAFGVSEDDEPVPIYIKANGEIEAEDNYDEVIEIAPPPPIRRIDMFACHIAAGLAANRDFNEQLRFLKAQYSIDPDDTFAVIAYLFAERLEAEAGSH